MNNSEDVPATATLNGEEAIVTWSAGEAMVVTVARSAIETIVVTMSQDGKFSIVGRMGDCDFEAVVTPTTPLT